MFLAKKLHRCSGTATLFPDMAPYNFFFFPKMKTTLKGRLVIIGDKGKIDELTEVTSEQEFHTKKNKSSGYFFITPL